MFEFETRWFWPLSVVLLVSFTGLLGCFPANPRLEHYDPTAGYRFSTLESDSRNTDETFVILTFSGGGTRAAAFAYGVLAELHDTRIDAERTLLDEVDVISSVSGGSFAAAYYGLFGQEAFFSKFPEEVLYRKIERDLILRILAPWNWPSLLSPNFSRTDLAAQYYDTHIFEGRRFADLPLRPFLLLNATDIGRGAQFSFTQEHFDRLCSDLSEMHVSRAVMASSAFPVAFPPVTLRNYGKLECGYEAPVWVELAEHGDFSANPQRYDLAKTWRSYEDNSRRPFIHLSDGGISDNIGLRAPEASIFGSGSLAVLDGVNNRTIKRLVAIVVDAKPETEAGHDHCVRPPGIFTVLNAAATNPMENYSSDTVERFRVWFNEWNKAARDFEARRDGCDKLVEQMCESAPPDLCQEKRRAECYASVRARDRDQPPHPDLHLMHVRFEAIPDEDAKRTLKGIETRLQLSKPEVDLLVEWARRLLRESNQYQQLVKSLNDGALPESPLVAGD